MPTLPKWLKMRASGFCIVVPTTVLMEQWCERLSEVFPEARIGRISKDDSDDFSSNEICVGIINSLVRDGRLEELFSFSSQHAAHPDYRTVLIADECHHYINGQIFRRVRDFDCDSP